MATNRQDRRLLSVAETAARLNLSISATRRKIAEGTIPAVRLGDGYAALRVDPVELDAWLHGEPEDAA